MATLFDSFLNFDLSIFEWVQTIQNPVLTTVMKFITTLGEDGIFFILLGLILLLTKKFRKAGVAILVSLIVMEVGNNIVLKELIARPRPFYIFNPDEIPLDHKHYAELLEKCTAAVERLPELAKEWVANYNFPEIVARPSSWSFPSGHTSSAFAAMVALFVYNKKAGSAGIVFAFLMGFSRIYVEVHYPTDVIAGVIVGIVYALLGVLITKYLFPVVDKIIDSIFSKIKGEKAGKEAA